MTIVVDVPPTELVETYRKIQSGAPYTVTIKPKRNKKTLDQNDAIWGKIGEIADALYANKEEIYEECLRRYGQGRWKRIMKDELPQELQVCRLVDIKKDHGDGSITVMCYKGLSQMDSAEASRLLEGILDECREIGISSEIRHE